MVIHGILGHMFSYLYFDYRTNPKIIGMVHKIFKPMKTFQEYDQENPHLWELYKMIAFEFINYGYIKIGSKRICEQIRWHHKVKTNEPYKISNTYTAYYARKFVNEFPQFAGLFNFKSLRSSKI